MAKIIVADDEELIRRLVCDFLIKEGHTPIEAENGEEALNLFFKNPDTRLLILDIMMPLIDGWEVTKQIREKSSVPILLLTARSQEFDELTGFDVGADDYVTKPFSPTVLMKRVETLLRRKVYSLESNHTSLGELYIDKDAHRVSLNNEDIPLTLKEYEILLKLIGSIGRVFSREQLLDDLWGYNYMGDVRTVDSHLARLRTKLGDWGEAHLKTVYGLGYKVEINEYE